MAQQTQLSILFVCLGNICRSPMAEGIFRSLAGMRGLSERFHVDSAGTGDWNIGKPPSPPALAIAAESGFDISALRARQIAIGDFDRFDLILGMDDQNLEDLRAIAPAGSRANIAQFYEYATGESREVPDPYFGGREDYEQAYRLIRAASEALLDKLE